MSLDRRTLLTGAAATLGLVGLGAFAPATAEAATTYVVVNCTNLNVRRDPSTRYPRVGQLPVGSRFTGVRVGTWVRITSGTFTGRYVSTSYLREVRATAPSTGRYVTRIVPVTGGVPLRRGWNGTRVYLVQKKLGMERYGSNQTYDDATYRAVRAYQARYRLGVDGVVGPKTWAHMRTGWAFTTDAYQVQPQLPLSATPAQRIEKMVAYALAQRGSRYTWGGAGPYKLGFDCSGLVLQALYAAGLDPQPINVVKHAEPTYRTSRELYAHPALRSVPRSQMRRGDLIFYGSASGVVHHVTINLGNGTMMEAYGRYAAPRKILTQYRNSYIKPYVKRPFF